MRAVAAGQLLAHHGIPERATLAGQLAQEVVAAHLDDWFVPGARRSEQRIGGVEGVGVDLVLGAAAPVVAADAGPFVGQRGHRDAPAVIDVADDVPGRDDGIGQEHLVERATGR